MTVFCVLVCSAVLGGVMGFRALNSGKFMPSGLIAVIRLITFSVFFSVKVVTLNRSVASSSQVASPTWVYVWCRNLLCHAYFTAWIYFPLPNQL